VRIQLVPQSDQPDFLDLPWRTPLEEWESDRLVEVARGIGTHVVRFVQYGDRFYALKELPPPLADREYRLLRALAEEEAPAVKAVGVVHDRGPDLRSVLITRYLEFSLPYRLAIIRLPDQVDRLLDAFVQLLVRIHLVGFFWGDCSLSNALFRRDAGALAAYLVDTETSELHEELSDGQRLHDLERAEENVFAELLDVEAELGPDERRDPETISTEVRARYDRLWSELLGEEEFGPGEGGRVAERVQRLNKLGFDAEELELISTDAGYKMRVHPSVVEPGHHRRRLLRLTGLEAQENQAKRLLEDIDAFRASLVEAGQKPVSDAAVAGRWLADVFEPTIAAVPPELWTKRQAAQLYHELLEHRWYLSEREGREVGMDEAVQSYINDVLRGLPDERALIVGDDE
jgi:hypothetical protein